MKLHFYYKGFSMNISKSALSVLLFCGAAYGMDDATGKEAEITTLQRAYRMTKDDLHNLRGDCPVKIFLEVLLEMKASRLQADLEKSIQKLDPSKVPTKDL